MLRAEISLHLACLIRFSLGPTCVKPVLGYTDVAYGHGSLGVLTLIDRYYHLLLFTYTTLTRLCSPPSSYNKKDSDSAGALAKLKDLEAQLNSKEAMLATALSEKRGLEATLADLQEQLQEVQYCCNMNMIIMLERFFFTRKKTCFSSLNRFLPTFQRALNGGRNVFKEHVLVPKKSSCH